MNIEFNKNEDALKLAWSRTKKLLEKIHEGGGKKAAAKQKERNKLTARERIAYLCDTDKPFIELGAFAGFEMYEEQGGCPAGSTVKRVTRPLPAPLRNSTIRLMLLVSSCRPSVARRAATSKLRLNGPGGNVRSSFMRVL